MHQKIYDIEANQLLTINHIDASTISMLQKHDSSRLFSKKMGNYGIDFNHTEIEFSDFNIQLIIPHQFSQYGPSLSVGDIDGNGMEDVFIGGAMGSAGIFVMNY